MDKLSLEARLKAEMVSFSGKVSYYVNDFKGNGTTRHYAIVG